MKNNLQKSNRPETSNIKKLEQLQTLKLEQFERIWGGIFLGEADMRNG